MSLRTRLLSAVGVAALLALLGADFATYSFLRSSLLDRVDQTLEQTTAMVPHGPLPGHPEEGGGEPGPPPQVVNHAPGIFVELRDVDGAVDFRYPAYEPPGKEYSPAIPSGVLNPDARSAGNQQFLTTPSTTPGGPSFRVLVTRTPDGDQLILGQPLDSVTATLHDLLGVELAVTAAALLAAVVVGVWLVRLGLQPLVEVERTAQAIADGELDRRVPGEGTRTEVGRLAHSLNVMLARIERAFGERDATEAQLRRSEETLRRFVADASHELRTPLAAVSAYSELLQRAMTEHPDDVGRLMVGIREESGRMTRLVEDLFLLARLDEGLPLEHEPVELVALAADAVHAANAVGPVWPVSFSADQPIEVYGDRGRLRQVLDNLLANARAHTPPGTPVSVRVDRVGSSAELIVADRGPGFGDGEIEHLFERFYRADTSRSRASGGSGLGLSIAAAIVAAHDGTVRALETPGGGATFVVSLPVAVDDEEEYPAGSARAEG